MTEKQINFLGGPATQAQLKFLKGRYGGQASALRIAIDRMYREEHKEMKGFYITGTHGSYIELEDGRWADTVSEDDGQNRNVEELLLELGEQEDGPTHSYLSLDELKAYVGAE